jgi:hypothetical protein
VHTVIMTDVAMSKSKKNKLNVHVSFLDIYSCINQIPSKVTTLMNIYQLGGEEKALDSDR